MMTVEYVTLGNSSYPVPSLRRSWSKSTKLEWHAATVNARCPGVNASVSEADYRVAGIKQCGYWNVHTKDGIAAAQSFVGRRSGNATRRG